MFRFQLANELDSLKDNKHDHIDKIREKNQSALAVQAIVPNGENKQNYTFLYEGHILRLAA